MLAFLIFFTKFKLEENVYPCPSDAWGGIFSPFMQMYLTWGPSNWALSLIPLYVSQHWSKHRSLTVHPQNVRFQNVRFQNVWNVRFTKRQVYKMPGLQNVRFTKRQVFKTPGCKKTFIYVLYLWLVEIRRFSCSHVCSQSDGCVLFSILEGFLAIYHHNK